MFTTLRVSYWATCLFSIINVINASISPIEIKGNKFFYSNNGSQFFMKGVAYQEDASGEYDYIDPLKDKSQCERDLPYFLGLGTNVIRVYAIDPTEDHDDCINLLADNGIYIVSDLSEPATSIARDSPSWDVDLLNRYTSVVDALQGYDNVLGFFAGNEVTNDNTNTDASAFVKAAIRDTKAYIKEKGYRSIPVGYATNDDENTRDYLAEYFNCGDSDSEVDFYGINIYEWCGDQTFESSGYKDRTEEFQNYSVPIFFSEYGCNTPSPRTFTDTPVLYSDEMTDVWSGGIVYMYFEESNNYGLVSIDGDSASTMADYSYLSAAIATVSPSSINSNSFTATNTKTNDCPASTLANWKASTSLPPTPDESICNTLNETISCVVADTVDSENYADLYSYACNLVNCTDITANGTTGVYGKYSYCGTKEKLSYILNKYYEEKGECSFSGSATLLSSTSSLKASSSHATSSAAISSSSGVGLSSSSSTGASSTGASSTGASSIGASSIGASSTGASSTGASLTASLSKSTYAKAASSTAASSITTYSEGASSSALTSSSVLSIVLSSSSEVEAQYFGTTQLGEDYSSLTYATENVNGTSDSYDSYISQQSTATVNLTNVTIVTQQSSNAVASVIGGRDSHLRLMVLTLGFVLLSTFGLSIL